MLADVLRADAKLAGTMPVLLGRIGVNNFALRVRAKSEYRRNPLLEETAVTPAQRGRIYRAFLPKLKLTGLYPVDDDVVLAATIRSSASFGDWRD